MRPTKAALRSVRKSGSRQSIGEKYQPIRMFCLRAAAANSAHVAPKRGGGHVVVARAGVPEQKAVAVFRGEHHVFHAGVLGDGHPAIGIELSGVELPVKTVVNGNRDWAVVRALGVGIGPRPTDFRPLQADRPPVDEHPESRLRHHLRRASLLTVLSGGAALRDAGSAAWELPTAAESKRPMASVMVSDRMRFIGTSSGFSPATARGPPSLK